MNRRRQIELTPEEQRAYLQSEKTVILCTIDGKGYPHAVAMWFALVDGLVHMTTFRKSQKVVNVRRDPKATLLVETGTEYSELKGLMIRCRTEIVDDVELCIDILADINARYSGQHHPSFRDVVRSQAEKRVALRFHPEQISSWDHSKLGGVY
jgi:general stress protein 26